MQPFKYIEVVSRNGSNFLFQNRWDFRVIFLVLDIHSKMWLDINSYHLQSAADLFMFRSVQWVPSLANTDTRVLTFDLANCWPFHVQVSSRPSRYRYERDGGMFGERIVQQDAAPRPACRQRCSNIWDGSASFPSVDLRQSYGTHLSFGKAALRQLASYLSYWIN